MANLTQLTAVIALGALTVTSASAEIIAQFEFNETAGGISTALDSSSNGFSWVDDSDVALTGSGGLAFSGGFANSASSGTYSAISSGSIFARLDLDPFAISDTTPGVNRDDGQTQLRFGFDFGSGTTVMANWRLRDDSRALQIIDGTATGVYSQFATDGTDSDGVSVIFGINLDTDTYSVWMNDTRAAGVGNYVAQATDTALASTISSLAAPRIHLTQYFNDGDDVVVDFAAWGTDFNEIAGITPAAVPEPSTVGLFAGLMVMGFAYTRRRRG